MKDFDSVIHCGLCVDCAEEKAEGLMLPVEEEERQPARDEEETTDEEKFKEVYNEERNEEEVEEYNEGINWIEDKYWGWYRRMNAFYYFLN